METANRRLTDQSMSVLPHYVKGGAIRGKGTGTSDQVPIMASNGEFMIKASAVKKIGIEALEAINAMGDAPEEKDSKAEAKAEYGAVRKMATGGLIDDNVRRGVAPYVNHRATSAPPFMESQVRLTNGMPPAVLGTAVGPASYQPNFTMGANPAPVAPAPGAIDVRAKYNPANGSPEAKAWMASQQPAAPSPQAAAPAQPKGPGAINRMNAAFTGMTGMGGEPSRAMGAIARTGQTAVKAAGRLAAPLGVINEGVDVGKVAFDPNASGIDVATQASQGAARLASAGVGAAAGAAAGSVVPVVGTAIGGIAGGLLGYYGANKAIEAGRSAVGVAPRSPADRAPSLVTPSSTANAAPMLPAAPQSQHSATSAPGAIDPRNAEMGSSRSLRGDSAGQAPIDMPTDQYGRKYLPGAVSQTDRTNGYELIRNAFNYAPKTGEVSNELRSLRAPGALQKANAGFAMLGLGIQASYDDKGQLSLTHSTAPEKMQYVGKDGKPTANYQDTQQYAEGVHFGQKNIDYANKLEAENRDFADRNIAMNRGRGAIRDYNANKTAQRGQDLQATQQGAVQKLAQQKFGLESATAGIDNQLKGAQAGSAAQTLAAQKALLNPANTPAQQAAAEENYARLTGKFEKPAKFSMMNLPDREGVMGTLKGGQAVIDSNGQIVEQKQGKASVPDAATAKTQALAALKANPANKDEINKRLAAAGYQPI